MFSFFDFFAKTLNYEPGQPRDRAEERREASMATRRVQARHCTQKAEAQCRESGVREQAL
ncbi:hypothetical protein IB229_20355 [Pseudomonas sp. PDM14]|uniref:hypothetical protein n=1 Tax=Pseudomonas sp. PDM14 TaxID=2769288 RepID=UPI0017826981|nr:hypothetical protein [Pseudomonas sp. PDM14]MBD9485340.1 hypothetical protein [Pseudomonas sp. PDM14]